MPFFVDVILPLPIPKLFTYLVTEEEYDFIQPGIRIVVPFGNTKKYAALMRLEYKKFYSWVFRFNISVTMGIKTIKMYMYLEVSGVTR